MEREFKIRAETLALEDYKALVQKIEDLIPKRKITKFGQNFRIAPLVPGDVKGGIRVETFDTMKDDLFSAALQ
jgi:inositol 1,4,5-triphosphate receptor type 1